MVREESLTLNIGGIGVRLTGDTNWKFDYLKPFHLFTSSDQSHVNYQIQIDSFPEKPIGVLEFNTQISWQLYRQGDKRTIWVGSQNDTPLLVGEFNPDYHKGTIFISKSRTSPDKYLFPLNPPLGEVLMSSLLGTGYGVMFHACGIKERDSGILFAGVSTAGKSTTARLWFEYPGVQVLNDDRIIVRKIGDNFYLFGTPWHGQGGCTLADQAPLKKIFILRHAEMNYTLPLSAGQAASALLVRSFAPLWDAKGVSFTLQFLAELCESIPCYEFGFVPDHTAVDYVRCLP